jgi:hypothetical protein
LPFCAIFEYSYLFHLWRHRSLWNGRTEKGRQKRRRNARRALPGTAPAILGPAGLGIRLLLIFLPGRPSAGLFSTMLFSSALHSHFYFSQNSRAGPFSKEAEEGRSPGCRHLSSLAPGPGPVLAVGQTPSPGLITEYRRPFYILHSRPYLETHGFLLHQYHLGTLVEG